MHEFGIAQKILEISAKELETRKLSKPVEKIVLRVGRLKAILPDSLNFHFDILKQDLPLFKAAVLDIRQIPVTVLCTGCGNKQVIEEPIFLCSQCGAPLAVQSGEELEIESIEVAD